MADGKPASSKGKGASTLGGTPPPSSVALHTHTKREIQAAGGKHFDFSEEFVRYRRNGEYRVVRCDFPQLMGWSTLRRPSCLPRSLKYPYFSGKYAPLSLAKERLSRPHVNRLRLIKDSDESMAKNLPVYDLPENCVPFEPDENAGVSQLTHEEAEKARNEPKRLMALRRRMFKHFKLFREDYTRQPAIQEGEIGTLSHTLDNAQRFLGPTSYGVYELQQNVEEQHKIERLYKEEYWPALHVFNPIKCRYLGINRLYCKTRTYPVPVNLARLANKEVPTYEPPPARILEEDRIDESKLQADLSHFNLQN